jgi:hypothetical protein
MLRERGGVEGEMRRNHFSISLGETMGITVAGHPLRITFKYM